MPVDFGQRPISVTRAAAVPDVVPGASCEPEIDFVQNPSAGASDMKRSLAIEELGTSFQVEKRVPLVRLKGHWLKAAGFTAGKRVTVTCLSPGVMELRAETVPATGQASHWAPRAVPEAKSAGLPEEILAEYGLEALANLENQRRTMPGFTIAQG